MARAMAYCIENRASISDLGAANIRLSKLILLTVVSTSSMSPGASACSAINANTPSTAQCVLAQSG